MDQQDTARTPKSGTQQKLLEAAVTLIREKGYTSTSVDELCAQAGVTKGAFFHHFESKADLALAAAGYWSERTGDLFRTAAYHLPSDPRERLLAYVDFRKELLHGEVPEFTCLVGTMVQEVYDTHPAIREACEQSIYGHAATLEPDIAEAMRLYGVGGGWTARSLALYTQAVIQGSFILAKAEGGVKPAEECLDHLRRYVELLFPEAQKGLHRV